MELYRSSVESESIMCSHCGDVLEYNCLNLWIIMYRTGGMTREPHWQNVDHARQPFEISSVRYTV